MLQCWVGRPVVTGGCCCCDPPHSHHAWRSLHQETGQAVVADLIDARQPPSRWPLRELADRLARLANNVPPGGRLPDLDGRWEGQGGQAGQEA